MKKDLYDEIITVARENELAGILHVATFDPDITPEDFAEIIKYKNKVVKEIGK